MSESLTRIGQLEGWLDQPEHEHLKFKEAKNSFDLEKLLKYGVALANERGGVLLLGVTDKRPRQVVGTRAFDNIQDIQRKVTEALRLRP